MRGKGNAGAAKAARAALYDLDLRQFIGADAERFRERLDAETKKLLSRLPPKARHWGLARKVLNIYLRDCFYTTYLHDEFKLRPLEDLLEVPIDKYVAKGLKKRRKRRALPKWTAIRDLTPVDSARFQTAASEEGAKLGVARVHLDAFFWSADRDHD